MTAIAWDSIATTTSTPFSEATAKSVSIGRLPEPALADLAEPAWQRPVAEQLAKVLALEEGWDGFGSGRIRGDVVEFVLDLLAKIMKLRTPAPHIAPMSHEGVMLVWHQSGIDMEIEIEKPGTLWVAFEDEVEGVEDEGSVSSDLSMVAMRIEMLTERAV